MTLFNMYNRFTVGASGLTCTKGTPVQTPGYTVYSTVLLQPGCPDAVCSSAIYFMFDVKCHNRKNCHLTEFNFILYLFFLISYS